MSQNTSHAVVSRAKKLQIALRTARNTDKTVRITRTQVDLLDRGLCSLISNYEEGSQMRARIFAWNLKDPKHARRKRA